MSISSGQIHDTGRTSFIFPFKVFWLKNDSDTTEDTAIISIPKRFFKRAVKRNKLRRRTKEALRLWRKTRPDASGFHLMLVYSTSEILEYDRINEAVGKILDTLTADA